MQAPYIRKLNGNGLHIGPVYRNQFVSLLVANGKIVGMPISEPVNRGYIRKCSHVGKLGGLCPMLKKAGLSEHKELKVLYSKGLRFMITAPNANPGWAIEVPPVPAALPPICLFDDYRELLVTPKSSVHLPEYYLHLAGVRSVTANLQVTFRCGDWFHMEIALLPEGRQVECFGDLKMRLGKYMAYIDGAAYTTRVSRGELKLPDEFTQRFHVLPGTSLRCSYQEERKSIVLEAPDVECDECGRKIRALVELPCKSHNCTACGDKQRKAV